MKTKDNNTNRGFSLVELIIVVAIMAILAGAIAPALIKYIAKTRKATDISNADEIAKCFTRLILENEIIGDYVNTSAGTFNNGRTANQYYRVIAFANAPRGRAGFKPADFKPLNVNYAYPNQATLESEVKNGVASVLGTSIPRISFQKANSLDEWIVCIDSDCSIYVFVGAGMNQNRYFMSQDGHNDGGKGRQCYMLYPEVDPAYDDLSKPPAAPN